MYWGTLDPLDLRVMGDQLFQDSQALLESQESQDLQGAKDRPLTKTP